MVNESDHIVIVGGGVGGLYAGWLLASRGYKCTLLEAEDRLGGRILTKQYGEAKYECGGSKLLESHKLTLGLVRSFDDYKKGDLVKYPKNVNLVGTKLVYADVIERIRVLVKQLKTRSKAELLENTIEGLVGSGKEIDTMKTYSGYPHVFDVCNAWAALDILERDFIKSKYIITYTRGLETIIEKLAKMFVAAGGVIKTGWRVNEISGGRNGGFVIHGNGSVVKGAKVIMAVCPKLIKGMFGYDVCHVGEAVEKVSLIRVFAKGRKLDIGNIGYTYVPGKIQRLGQMGKGIYQIAYASGEKAAFWKWANKKEVMETFEKEWGRSLEEGPVSVEKYYWDVGVHVWGKGWDGRKVWKSLMNYGADHGVYVIGEAVCPYQRWVESALWTAKKVADSL